jgi:large subunit ribosomal protein L4
MQAQLIQDGNKSDQAMIDIADRIFATEYNEPLIHQIVTAYMAAGRAGTKSNKSRREVRGGGIKPWRQKGTGRARAGSIRSPLWRGGGVTFAAKTRSFQQKVNRKMYSAAMRSIFAELLRQERLLIVEDFNLTAAKTRDLIEKLRNLKIENTLIITHEVQNNLVLASRNLSYVNVVEATSIEPIALLSHDNVLITRDALRLIEEKLS